MPDIGGQIDWSKVGSWMLDYGLWIVVILAVAAGIFFALRKAINRVVGAIAARGKPRQFAEWVGEQSGLISRIIQWVVGVLICAAAVIAIISQLGVDVSPVTAALRAAGIAVAKWLGSHGVRILIIVVLAIILQSLLKKFVPRVVERVIVRRKQRRVREEIEKRAKTLSDFFANTGMVVIWVVAAFMILSEVGVNIGPLLAGAGVVGIAVGFGAQSLIKDILAGLFILLENQYLVGDVVNIAGIGGLVEEINLRRTVLRDLDGIVHVIPNGEIKISSNYTKEWSRVNINISVAYGEDLDHVIAVINRVGMELAKDKQWAPMIIQAPQVLRVDKLGNSGIEIKVLGDTKPIKQWDVMGELRKRIKKAFDEEGIEIPWPHTKVYFGNAPPQPDVSRGSTMRPSSVEGQDERYKPKGREPLPPSEEEDE